MDEVEGHCEFLNKVKYYCKLKEETVDKLCSAYDQNKCDDHMKYVELSEMNKIINPGGNYVR